MNMFRTLRADEIDCRISQIKEREGKPIGLSLLLYKDARCDQNILDETVTPMNWQRKHTRDNRNCIVAIWDDVKGQWIEKEDTGTESNTEKEKGLASDSFKRACFNWGIGRELYTSPFIWIKAEDCAIRKDSRGKWACYDRFTVKGISYTDGVITGLIIKNQANGKVCYSWGTVNEDEEAPEKPEQPDETPDEKPAPNLAVKSSTLPTEAISSQDFLQGAIKQLRIDRGITAKENNELFKTQFEELVKAGLAPDKKLAEYNLQEAQALIDAMYTNFAPEGTEVRG